jgi:hypothetical protein
MTVIVMMIVTGGESLNMNVGSRCMSRRLHRMRMRRRRQLTGKVRNHNQERQETTRHLSIQRNATTFFQCRSPAVQRQ